MTVIARTAPAQIIRIYGLCPVQADGTVAGLPFYFRARFDRWIFAIASAPDADPVQVAIEQASGFRVERRYGYPCSNDASFMDYSQVHRFIYGCARTYLNEREAHDVDR